ncbi:MAG TPA: long-chain fatty acid--CoA ligase [bacterium]
MSVQTLSQLFHHNVTNFNKPDLLVYRGQDGVFHKISSNEFKDRVVSFALGLHELGVKSETKVLLLSENRPEWHIADFACHLLGAVLVPIFPTLIPDQIEFIANNSDSEVIIVSNDIQIAKILQIRGHLKKLKHLIVMNPDAVKEKTLAFGKVLESGSERDGDDFLERATKVARPDEIATLIYTSGTTGTPKGVMLSHENLVSNFLACTHYLKLDASDVGLSFLPLSHAFERTVDYYYFYCGLSIIYSSNDTVAQDLEQWRPTIMAAVPRFYEKVRARVQARAEAESVIKKGLFNWAINVGRKKIEAELGLSHGDGPSHWQHSLADRLVFSKIKARTGGRMKYFISGSAPLSSEVATFFFSVGLTIIEGYGLTETSPIVAFNPPDRPKIGTVGKVLPGIQVKIANDGEIIVKGPNVMMGYYKMPAATAEVLEDGWLHTGDIGMLDEDNYLTITDRKKQLMVTSVGKKVAPQAIEKEVENSKYIDQVVLIGEKRNFISALIVPDFDALKTFTESRGITVNGAAELIQHPEIFALIQSEVDERQKRFSDYEKIRRFKLLPQPFTIEAGQLTPTMKVKRKAVEQEFAQLIEEMYAS